MKWIRFSDRLPTKNDDIWLCGLGNDYDNGIEHVFNETFMYLGASDDHAILEGTTGDRKVFELGKYAWVPIPTEIEEPGATP